MEALTVSWKMEAGSGCNGGSIRRFPFCGDNVTAFKR
jgi:hypothetical protein